MKRALGIARTVLLVGIALPFAAVGALLNALGFKEKRTAAEVAAYLRNFIDGGGGEWDSDDFISVPIADPKLDDIRKRASAVDLPPTNEGVSVLRALLAEADRLQST